MSERTHRYEMRVAYAACTIGNHVYYGRYLDFLEVARGEFFRALGFPLERLQREGLALPVVECRLQYRAPARYDDELTVETWVAALGRVRLDFACRIIRGTDVLLVEAVTRHACTGLDERPRRIPPGLGEALGAFLHSATHGPPSAGSGDPA